MYENIFDTHSHYDDESFDEDRDELLSSLKNKGVSEVLNCAVDLKTSKATLLLGEKFDFVFCALGIHPHEAEEAGEKDLKEIVSLLEHKKAKAIGEIGLDYHYDFSEREAQLKVFEEQIILSKQLHLPIIVHDREAHEDTLRLLKKHKPEGVVHCFSGSKEMAKEVLNLGMYLGFGGAVTFKNAKKPVEVCEYAPAERLLLETDCPYMTPVPFRGKRCDSSYISYTAEKISEIKNLNTQELIDICRQNAKELFKI